MALKTDAFNLFTGSTNLCTTVFGSNFESGKFTPIRSGNLTTIHLIIERVGNPGNGILSIRAVDGTNKPTGSDLAVANIPAIPVGKSVVTFTFPTPLAVTAGTRLAMIFAASAGASGTDFFNVEKTKQFGPTVVNEDNYTSSDSGSTWTFCDARNFTFVTELDNNASNPALDQFSFGGAVSESIGDFNVNAQTFTPSETGDLKKIQMAISSNSGAPGTDTLTFEVRTTDGGGLPTATVLATESRLISSFTLTTSPIKEEITFTTPATLTAGVKYAIVMSLSAPQSMFLHRSNEAFYSPGQRITSTDFGVTFIAQSDDYLLGTFMVVPTEQTITSDSTILATIEQTITSDAFTGQETEQTIFSDAFHGQETEKTILADSLIALVVEQIINSDSTIFATVEQTITSDAFSGQETEQTILSDSAIFATIEQTILSDSTIFATIEQTITSDAFHGQETEQTINSDTLVFAEVEQTITSDAFHGEETEQSIDADSDILVVVTETINSDTFIKEPVILFATAQVDKPSEDIKEFETDVSNDIPVAPTALGAVDGKQGDTVDLSWTSPARFFNVFRKDPGPTFVKLNDTVLDGVTTYKAGGLTTGVSVTFVVRAVNGIGQESPNSNETSATPTFAEIDVNSRLKFPTKEIKINSVVFTDAILETIRKAFGSSLTTATFTLPRDPRDVGNPALDDEIEITLNSRLVFKGFITTRSNLVDEGGGLRIGYNCTSTIINLTNQSLKETKIDEGVTRFNIVRTSLTGDEEIINRKTAKQILEPLGIQDVPDEFPGLIDITDLTILEAAELVLSRIGNFRLFHDVETGITSAYRFGSGGFNTREFGFGKNIIDFDIQESNIDVVNKIEVIGAPIQRRVRKQVFAKTGIGEDGRLVAQFELQGKNIRDVKVFGFARDKPIYTFNDNITVSLLDIANSGNFLSSFGRFDNRNLRSKFTFTQKSTITGDVINSQERDVEFDPVSKTATISTGGLGIKQTLREGNTFTNPATNEDFQLKFARNGLPTFVREQSGQTAQIINTDASSSDFGYGEINNLSPEDVKLRPIITNEEIFRSIRQQIATTIAYDGKDSIVVSLSEIPKKWIGKTKAGDVDRSVVGVSGDGTLSIRILLDYEFRAGAIEVEFVRDEDPPIVTVGSGDVCRSITDGQYAIVINETIGFDNTSRILQEMQIRANAELARLEKPSKGGSITVIGDETIDLRSTVTAIGEKLEVSAITHSFVNGFRTSVSLTNEPFIQTLILPPNLQKAPTDPRRLSERARGSISKNFEIGELAEAIKERVSARDKVDRQAPAFGRDSIWKGRP